MPNAKFVPFDSVEHQERRPGVVLSSLVDGDAGATQISSGVGRSDMVAPIPLRGAERRGPEIGLCFGPRTGVASLRGSQPPRGGGDSGAGNALGCDRRELAATEGSCGSHHPKAGLGLQLPVIEFNGAFLSNLRPPDLGLVAVVG